ncbi:MAG TPA: hypothetical protein DEA40_12420, partial [Parvularcula sp.]|nr:hypothetical protein [Parvularcula sp.]
PRAIFRLIFSAAFFLRLHLFLGQDLNAPPTRADVDGQLTDRARVSMTIAPAELRDNIDWAAFERAANGRQRRAPSPRRAALRGQAGAGVI